MLLAHLERPGVANRQIRRFAKQTASTGPSSTLHGNASNVFGVAVSPDGRGLATAGGDGTAGPYTLLAWDGERYLNRESTY